MQPVPLVAACSCLQGCSGLILRSGAPPTPTPASLRLPLLCKGRGKLGQPCTLVFPELQRGARRPRPSGASQAAASPGCPRERALPATPPVAPLAPSLQPRWPERAHRGSGTWARGRRRQLLPLRCRSPARAGEITLHAAGSAATFRSASGPSPARQAGEGAGAERGRTGPGGGARRAGASRALN